MIHQQTLETSATAIELGARFIMHSSDARILMRGTQNEFAELREVANKKHGGVDAVEAEDTVDIA
jgi:hypothetical protein